jgi:hypothetical protein
LCGGTSRWATPLSAFPPEAFRKLWIIVVVKFKPESISAQWLSDLLDPDQFCVEDRIAEIEAYGSMTRAANEIGWPLLSIFGQRHTIDLRRSKLVEIRYPIARLYLPTLAKHGNRCSLRLR